jgi:hypothetical protein
MSLGAVVVVLTCFMFVFLQTRTTVISNQFRGKNMAVLASVSLSIISIANHVLEDLPRYSQEQTATTSTDWYGTPTFVEVTDFIKRNTASNDLFAYSLCDTESEQYCITDMRPAALTKRRFLTLNPYGSFDLKIGFQADRWWSERIGVSPANLVTKYLKARQVRYVLAERSRISAGWISEATQEGVLVVFRNRDYVLMDLGAQQLTSS